jgi:hypothetical protein
MEIRDDGKVWGRVMPDGSFHVLPKAPMLLAGLGPPPFDVVLPDGQIRHVIEKPGQPEPVRAEPEPEGSRLA